MRWLLIVAFAACDPALDKTWPNTVILVRGSQATDMRPPRDWWVRATGYGVVVAWSTDDGEQHRVVPPQRIAALAERLIAAPVPPCGPRISHSPQTSILVVFRGRKVFFEPCRVRGELWSLINELEDLAAGTSP